MSRGAAARASAHAASWFERPAEAVARDLLGTLIVSTVGRVETIGRIVETEAYVGPHDAASHAAARIGRTLRNEAMYGRPGTAYVYRIYGVHWCLNVVTDQVGYPAAVLIRAVEPLDGLDHMRARRSPARARSGDRRASQHPGNMPDRLLANGPGKLAAALGVDGSLNTHRLDRKPLIIVRGEGVDDSDVSRGPRIGITRATDWPLRFWVRDSRWISR